MAPTLGYWKIRGLASPIRMALCYAGVEYEDELYEQGDGPAFDRGAWFDKKFNLGLSFPNLPYLIDGDIKMTQSGAIIRHIARTHKLYGASPEEMAMADMVADELVDLRSRITRIVYHPDHESLKAEHTQLLPNMLTPYEKYLSGDWFAGANVTYVDFMVYEVLKQHEVMLPACLDSTPKLKAFVARVEALPQLAGYFSSEVSKLPFNNKSAFFGGGWRK